MHYKHNLNKLYVNKKLISINFDRYILENLVTLNVLYVYMFSIFNCMFIIVYVIYNMFIISTCMFSSFYLNFHFN